MKPLRSPEKNRSIYALYCPISKLPMYVGSSCRPHVRAYEHYNEGTCQAHIMGGPKGRWIQALDALGQLRPEVVVLTENIPSSDAGSWERYWQIFYRLANPGMVNDGRRDWKRIKRAFASGHTLDQIRANPWLAVEGGMPPSAKDGTARSPTK